MPQFLFQSLIFVLCPVSGDSSANTQGGQVDLDMLSMITNSEHTQKKKEKLETYSPKLDRSVIYLKRISAYFIYSKHLSFADSLMVNLGAGQLTNLI